MIKTIFLILITLIGAFKFPIFTLGCVLVNYNHPVLGIIIIIYSFFKGGNDEDDIEYID